MTTHKEALKLALEAFDDRSSLMKWQAARDAVKEALAQPEQEQNLKLMPREATPEMLKAMDECSTEGYDERLYEGHAGSVYMAAWDAFYGQHCYCGDITNLGVIHRDDGPCHYPEHTSEYKRGYADAMNWKVQNHLEHLPAAQPEQEPVGEVSKAGFGDYPVICWRKGYVAKIGDKFYTTPPQRKPLTDEEIRKAKHHMVDGAYQYSFMQGVRYAEASHGIKE